MRPMEETITILYFENNLLEEMEIMKVTTSDHMLNIMQNNNPLYQILQPDNDQHRGILRMFL